MMQTMNQWIESVNMLNELQKNLTFRDRFLDYAIDDIKAGLDPIDSLNYYEGSIKDAVFSRCFEILKFVNDNIL